MIPNLLSLSRIFLAFAFLSENVTTRVVALALAMASDALDGYLARKLESTSKFGTLLDPLADKFFVFFVLTAFLKEGRLAPYEAGALLCRDFSVILYGAYLALKGTLLHYRFQAIWCGKITTLLQFVVLLGLTLGYTFPLAFFTTFIVLGICALGELYFFDHSTPMIKQY